MMQLFCIEMFQYLKRNSNNGRTKMFSEKGFFSRALAIDFCRYLGIVPK